MAAKTQQSFPPKITKRPPFSVEATGVEPKKGETIPRRHPLAKDKLISVPEPGITTVFDILKRSAEKFGNAKAVGFRRILNTHEEVKKVKKIVDGQEQMVDKKWSFYELSEYHYLSFIEFQKLVLDIGAGLRHLGMTKGDRVHIFAATSPWWLATAHAAATQSMPIVTAYDTLGEEGLKHSLLQTNAKCIYVDPHLLPTLINPLKEAKDIKFVVYNSEEKVKPENIEKLQSAHPELKIMSDNDLKNLGAGNPVEPVRPEPEDLCCIMYTSGSTGTPKGVPLKHRNVVAAVAGVNVVVGQYIGPGDALLTYLPLAHILEFVFENACMYWGGTMGYGNPRTLSDQSVRNCKGDIREFRPTILVGVPAVWESVKKGIMAKVNQSGPVVRNIFWGAMTAKAFLLNTGIPGTGILDHVVFKKIRDAAGGRLKICMNGGGPIAKDTQRFISLAICPMISGYGLTETTAMGALMDPAEWSDDTLGAPPASVEVKLVDFPDAGYYANNDPPQGEIWLRGDSILESYYQNEKETEEALTEDGWFRTGDIGEFDRNGHLKIIDRKKNLVKTQNGEYIALEKLESIYRSAPVVANICVYAAEDKTRPVAIIVPAEPALKKLAKDHGIDGHGLEDLVHDKKLQGIVLKELQNVGRQGGLQGIEIIDGVVMAEEEWTPQNGLVTSAQKLNRRGILQKYRKEVDEAYKSGN